MSGRKMTAVAALTALLAPAVVLAGGNPELGRTKSVPCQACHGEKGMSVAPNYPVLAGQHADYLVHALKQYRSGARKNQIMAGFAAGLSDDDIADLAAWFASQGKLVTPKP